GRAIGSRGSRPGSAALAERLPEQRPLTILDLGSGTAAEKRGPRRRLGGPVCDVVMGQLAGESPPIQPHVPREAGRRQFGLGRLRRGRWVGACASRSMRMV